MNNSGTEMAAHRRKDDLTLKAKFSEDTVASSSKFDLTSAKFVSYLGDSD